MQCQFLGAVIAGGSSLAFGRVVFNPEEQTCQHCKKVLLVGESFAVLNIPGLDGIAVHIECANTEREKIKGAGLVNGRRVIGGAGRASSS